MSKRWKVEWSEVAVRDLERLAEYLSTDGSSDAERVLERLEKAAGSLRQYPLRGRIAPELRPLEIASIRELVVAPWRLVYRVGAQRVLIIGVFDSRRDLELTLLARLTAIG